MNEKRLALPRFSLRTLFAAVAAIALVLCVVRLWPRVQVPDLDAIEVGMTSAEVREIIGKPEAGVGGMHRWTDLYHWPGYGSVNVEYFGDRVQSVRVVAIE